MFVNFISGGNIYLEQNISIDTRTKIIGLYTETGYYEMTYSGDVTFINDSNGLEYGESVGYDSSLIIHTNDAPNIDTTFIEQHVVQTMWQEMSEYYQNQWC